MARGKTKAKSIGEMDDPPRYVTVEQLEKVMAVVDEKFRAVWAECLDIRHGRTIRDEAERLEDNLKIE